MNSVMQISFAALILILTALPIEGRAAWFPSFHKSAARAENVRTIWIFEEKNFVGDFNARMAIAETFAGAEIKVFSPLESRDLESVLAEGFGVNAKISPQLYPDLLLHGLATEEQMRVLGEIKKRSKGKTFVAILDPRTSALEQADLVINPKHMPQVRGQTSVVRPLGIPSHVNAEKLNRAAREYESQLAHFPGPVTTLLVGGQAANTVFTMADAKILGETVRNAVKKSGGSLFVTNSRRTPDRAFRALLDELTGIPLYIHDVKQDEGNPYLALLAHSDHIIVTGDSSSMIADALTTGRPVYVFAPNSILEERHKAFLLGLLEAGYIQLLNTELNGRMQKPLDTAEDLHDLIENRRHSCARALSTR